MAARGGKTRKIVWAVDAFESAGAGGIPGALHQNSLETLRSLASAQARRPLKGAKPPEVWLTSVLSPATLSASVEFSGPWVTDLRPMAEERMNRVAERVRAAGFPDVRLKILIQPFVSTARAVQVLNRFAMNIGADFLLVGTHARKGIGRAFLGSFAESLIHHATLPVVTVNPEKGQRQLRDSKHVLFPTEFGPDIVAAKNAFRRAVWMASDLGASLTLFHVLPQPMEPFLQSGATLLGGTWIPISMYFSRAEESIRKHANAWTLWARGQGVKVDLVLETHGGQVSEAILKQARRSRAGWIVMEARTGPVASALVGSVTRQVLRISECPVIVLNRTRAAKARRPAVKAAA